MDDELLPARLRLGLRAALKSKDAVAASALRSALAAIANAEAVPQQDRSATGSEHIAGGTPGLGSAEAERKMLTREETTAIVQAEISEREATAQQYESAGHPERAARLRHEAEVIRAAFEDH